MNLNSEAGFFVNFSEDGLFRGFIYFDAAAWEDPYGDIASFNEKDMSFRIIENDADDAGSICFYHGYLCGSDVPRIGLEPTHLTAPEPKSGVSTNFTTWA